MQSNLNHKLLGLCLAAALASHCGFDPMKKKINDKAAPSPTPVPTRVEGAFLTACEARPNDGIVKAVLSKYSLGPSQCDEASLRLNRELSLDFHAAGIADLSALNGLKQLQWLNIADNKVTDISVIDSLPDLDFIDLSNNMVSKGPKLLDNCKLELFFARKNELPSLDFLATCHSLHSVLAMSNPLVDLDFTKHLENLSTIEASNTGIADISVLAGKPKIAVVDVSSSKVSDLSPLKNDAALYYLDAGNTPLDKTDAAKCPVSNDVIPALRNYCNDK